MRSLLTIFTIFSLSISACAKAKPLTKAEKELFVDLDKKAFGILNEENFNSKEYIKQYCVDVLDKIELDRYKVYIKEYDINPNTDKKFTKKEFKSLFNVLKLLKNTQC